MNDLLLRKAYALHQAGDLKEAALLYRDILRQQPKQIDALCMLGLVHAQRSELPDANRLADTALTIDTRSTPALHNLGWLLQNLDRFEDALRCYDRLLVLAPRQPEALFHRGNMLLRLRRHQDALVCFQHYVNAVPGNAEAWISHGAALYGLNALDDALASFGKAMTIAPTHTAALSSHAGILVLLSRYEEAIADYRALLKRDPKFDYAHGNLLQCLLACCDWRDLKQEKDAISAGLHEGRRMISPFQNTAHCTSAAEQLRAARVWITNDGPKPSAPLWRGGHYSHAKIRVAYISEDFCTHAVALLMTDVWEHHDRARFETVALSFGLDDASALRARAKNAFDRFIDIRHNSDVEVAQSIRDMEIDIAVDLMGFSGHSRPGILAHRPAPVQVNYLGFPGTMGVDYMDYIVADHTVIPEDAQVHFSEKVVYLPDTYQSNDSKRRAAGVTPSRTEAGLPEHGFVFCCFNNNFKILPEIFDIWMRLLRKTEGSVLWLLQDNPASARGLQREAQARGVAPGRLVFAPRTAPDAHLARQRLADLFLDTLPYGAHTTASDALWMGLPVLTALGHTFAGRVAASLLNAVGLPEMIAPTLEEYEALALKLAQDGEALRRIRAKLAHNRNTEALFDTARFTRHLEAAYAEMHRRHRQGAAPHGFAVERISASGPVSP